MLIKCVHWYLSVGDTVLADMEVFVGVSIRRPVVSYHTELKTILPGVHG